MRKILFAILLLTITTVPALSQDEEFKPTFKWKGFTHMWGSYVQQDSLDAQYGMTIRYLRMKAYGKLTPKLKWTVQYGFDKGNPALVDVFMKYEHSDLLHVTVGHFPVAGAKSGVMTSSLWSTTKLKFNDRNTIGQNWATLSGGYRNTGVMLSGGLWDKKLNYYIMPTMSKGGAGNFLNASVKSPWGNHSENGVALYNRLEAKPTDKIETGGSFHITDGVIDEATQIARSSYSIYFLTRQEKLYVMGEVIGGNVTTEVDDVESKTDYFGYVAEAAYKVTDKVEPAVRYDSYTPSDGNPDKHGFENYNNLTVGLNYYPIKPVALMFNYVLRMETPADGFEEINNDMIYLQLRLKFASK